MKWQEIYLTGLLLSVTVMVLMAAYAWRHRRVKGAASLMWLLTIAGAFSLGIVFAILSHDPATARVWWKLVLTNIILVPVVWMRFSLQYIGYERWLSPRYGALLMIVPFISLLLLWTTEIHGAFWRELSFYESSFLMLPTFSYGFGYRVHAVYSYALIMLGMVLLVRVAIRSLSTYRRQTVALIVGALAPVVVSLLSTLGGVQLPIIPIGFALSGAAFGWAVFRYQLLDLVPVARDTMIDSMSDAMIVLDGRDRIVDLNPAMEDILATWSGDAVGRPVAEVLAHKPSLVAHFSDRATVQNEIVVQRIGALRTYDLRISPLTDRRGRATGRLIVLRDVTANRAAERALREYARELEISNAELDAFAHTVAHGLKSPLATMVGFSNLLEARFDKFTREMTIENLRRISQTGYKLTNIIDELLLLSGVRKMEDVPLHELDMAATVAEAQHRLRDVIAAHHAEVSAPATWPQAQGYAPWVEEVWVNYISNAVKYGGRPEEGIAPQVVLGWGMDGRVGDHKDVVAEVLADGQRVPSEQESQGDAHPGHMGNAAASWSDIPARHIRFWVRDNGPGLTAQDQAQLFTQFTRLHEVRAEGHGLGLSIVRRIVEKLGGTVGVESAVGQGSVFWFTLPVFQESHFATDDK